MRTPPTKIIDSENYVVAEVTRMRDFKDYDYVAIRKGDNVITVEIAQVPDLLRAIMKAANT